jgi:hypothetical protein
MAAEAKMWSPSAAEKRMTTVTRVRILITESDYGCGRE